MSLSVNFGDKLPSGVHTSITIITPDGPPTAEVKHDGRPLEARLRKLDTDKWKLRFLIPSGVTGELAFRITAGSSVFSESKSID